ncbi:PREDICTED: uncharacterized protein LOC109463465 [Branchiostoma belcheri]|uniref:Uncharacterized protein LOC109463465 n=1 Tax=Branchiostoma belcheri TaxID=7741 RepID=A0A6P4YAL3_BRABE|nr:PREDICTED: uncharacterized protein LOC109463465 [Branchiostoma belcheri]
MAASMYFRVFTLFFAVLVLALFAGCEGRSVDLSNQDELEAERVRRQAVTNSAATSAAPPAQPKGKDRTVFQVIFARGYGGPFFGVVIWCIIVVIAFIAAYVVYQKVIRKPEDEEARRQRLAVAY